MNSAGTDVNILIPAVVLLVRWMAHISRFRVITKRHIRHFDVFPIYGGQKPAQHRDPGADPPIAQPGNPP